MDQDLRVSFDAFVELLICCRSVVNADLMGNDEARLCSSSNDEITQVPVIRLHIALTSAEVEALKSVSE